MPVFWITRVSWRLVIVFTGIVAIDSLGHAVKAASLTLEQAIGIAVRDNKDLRAARFTVERARSRLVQAGLPPNPRLELSTRSDFLFGNEGEYSASVALSQQFPIAGRIARQQDVARVDVDLAFAEINAAERRLAGEVAVSFYRLAVLDRQVEERTRLMGVNEQLVKVTRNRFKAAEVSELDVTSAQVELQRLAQERTLLQSQQVVERGRLNQLLGQAATRPLEVDATLPELKALPNLAQLQQRALTLRPDLQTEVLGTDRARAELALAHAERWEDWTVGLGVEQDRLAITGAPPQDPDRAVGVTLSIPLPLRNKNQGRIAEAMVAGTQAVARIEALTTRIRNQVVNARAEIERLRQALQEYQDSLFLVSARNVSLAQLAYDQGQAPIFAVVQAQRQNSDLHVAYLNLLDQYLQALARLRYGLVGGSVGDTALPGQPTPDTVVQ